MSKVKLITCEGYGSEKRPRIGGTEKVINIEIEIPDTHDITGIVRYDFDPETNGDKRLNDDINPIIKYECINNLVGKLLTIADASFTDVEQRKAFKDLLKQAAWNWYWAQSESLTEPWRLDKFPKYKDAFNK